VSKQKLVKGTKVRVKGISEQGISRTNIHGKVWVIDRIVHEINNLITKKGPLLVLKSCDNRNVCVWYNYKKDPHLKITQYIDNDLL
jgi:hypothetical protein